jgi:hypothetical protein
MLDTVYTCQILLQRKQLCVWKLHDRYDHPFVMQKTFRKKLENWPKFWEGNSKALRDGGVFLQACRDATTQVPSLKIDHCSENQKLFSKLPSRAALLWNREVQETGDYPSFSKFVDFVVKGACIACNPVLSIIDICTQGKWHWTCQIVLEL